MGRALWRHIASMTSRENSLPTVLTPIRAVGLKPSMAATICGCSLARSCGSNGLLGGSLWAIGKYNVPNMAMFANTVTGPASLFQTTPTPWATACDPDLAQTPHPSGMLVAMADGSVRNVSASISQTTWTNALLPNDGNPLGNDWSTD